MSRLAPLIVRRTGPHAAELAWPEAGADEAPSTWLEDFKLFLVGWFGGLIFFSTLLG